LNLSRLDKMLHSVFHELGREGHALLNMLKLSLSQRPGHASGSLGAEPLEVFTDSEALREQLLCTASRPPFLSLHSSGRRCETGTAACSSWTWRGSRSTSQSLAERRPRAPRPNPPCCCSVGRLKNRETRTRRQEVGTSHNTVSAASTALRARVIMGCRAQRATQQATLLQPALTCWLPQLLLLLAADTLLACDAAAAMRVARCFGQPPSARSQARPLLCARALLNCGRRRARTFHPKNRYKPWKKERNRFSRV
jgi:hypothetical protein